MHSVKIAGRTERAIDMRCSARWLWLVLLLLGLGGGLGLPGVGYGQEGLPPAGGEAAWIEEARRLHAESDRLYRKGKYAAALPMAQRALALREQALGPAHPDVATSLNNLAVLALAQGDPTHAVLLRTRSSAIRERTLTLMLTLGTEAQKLASATTLRADTNGIVSLHTRSAPTIRRPCAWRSLPCSVASGACWTP